MSCKTVVASNFKTPSKMDETKNMLMPTKTNSDRVGRTRKNRGTRWLWQHQHHSRTIRGRASTHIFVAPPFILFINRLFQFSTLILPFFSEAKLSKSLQCVILATLACHCLFMTICIFGSRLRRKINKSKPFGKVISAAYNAAAFYARVCWRKNIFRCNSTEYSNNERTCGILCSFILLNSWRLVPRLPSASRFRFHSHPKRNSCVCSEDANDIKVDLSMFSLFPVYILPLLISMSCGNLIHLRKCVSSNIAVFFRVLLRIRCK